jgi:hypothetical protein
MAHKKIYEVLKEILFILKNGEFLNLINMLIFFLPKSYLSMGFYMPGDSFSLFIIFYGLYYIIIVLFFRHYSIV